MSNKNSDHKQMLRFLDRIHKAADIWTKVDEKIHIQQMRDSSSREKKPVT